MYVHMMSAQRGTPKAVEVRQPSKGGCVKMQIGGGGLKIQKCSIQHMYMAPQALCWPVEESCLDDR